jgi:hypothetical protein
MALIPMLRSVDHLGADPVGSSLVFGINRVEHHIEHLLEKGRERERKEGD